MPDYSYADLLDPTFANTFPGQLVGAARTMACNLYKNNPIYIFKNPVGDAVGTPMRMLMDRLCQPTPGNPPPPAQPQFQGGQCNAVSYDVNLHIKEYYGSLDYCGLTRDAVIGAQVYGPISDIKLENFGQVQFDCPGVSGYSVISAVCRGNTSGAIQNLGKFNIAGNSGHTIASITSIDVVRSNGQPDTCGNGVPYMPPTSPPVEQVTNNINIQIGTDSVNVPIYVVPVLVEPTLEFRPSFVVNVGGVNVKFDMGGVYLSIPVNVGLNFNLPFSKDPRPLPPSSTTPPPTSLPPCSSTVDLQPIKDKLDTVDNDIKKYSDKEKPYKESDYININNTTLGNANSGDYAIPNGTYKITLEVTDTPTNQKVQFGNDGANVVYAGWAWFGDDQFLDERMPVDADYKLYLPPERFGSRFMFTLYKGYKATIRAYYVGA